MLSDIGIIIYVEKKDMNMYLRYLLFPHYMISVCLYLKTLQFQPNPYAQTLKCYYSNMKENPILVLAPVKVEELYHHPNLLQFHDVVSENEISLIKNLSTPMVCILDKMCDVKCSPLISISIFTPKICCTLQRKPHESWELNRRQKISYGF